MNNNPILLSISDVKGSSTLDGHKDEIECLSWSFGVEQPTSNAKTGTERTSARPIFSDIIITKESDVSSTELFRLCSTGKEIEKVVLTIDRHADEENKPLIVVTLDMVILSNYSITCDANSRPIETVSLNYAKIKMEYNHQGVDGKIAGKTDFGYDLSINKKA